MTPEMEMARGFAKEEQKEVLQMMEKTAKLADVKLKIQPLKSSDDWPEFKFRVEVFAATLGFEEELRFAEIEQTVVTENRLTMNQRAFSKILSCCRTLVQLLACCAFYQSAKASGLGMSYVGVINRSIEEDIVANFRSSLTLHGNTKRDHSWAN